MALNTPKTLGIRMLLHVPAERAARVLRDEKRNNIAELITILIALRIDAVR